MSETAAPQPGADAELVERLRKIQAALASLDQDVFGSGSAPMTAPDGESAEMRWPIRDEMIHDLSAAIARLSAPAGPGSEGGEAIWWARMEYLFEALPFVVRHRWGGDAREMVEGLDAARAALEASGADHHDAGTGET